MLTLLSYQVREGESFPADMVLLQSSLPAGKCYVETAELDGETNLKIRNAASDLVALQAAADTAAPESRATAGDEAAVDFDPTLFEQMRGVIECDPPNNELYSFNGTYTHGRGSTLIALTNECVLLRGARLRNTERAYGLVVYTGKETKLSMNMTAGPKKRSNVERIVDRLIRMIFVALFVVAAISTAKNFAFADRFRDVVVPYLPFLDASPLNVLFAAVTFVILFNTFVPISLYVTLETVKVFQARLISHDPVSRWQCRATPASVQGYHAVISKQ